ncbi:hypothetical protein [Bradyrhizobium sp. 151]|uniref:hypothetical protein n=1 Tax=Bradyrhizobium sp. 151 TaxID=2782626 RepID=UPI001FF81F5D|nr:hypothetical protein [Bradyrhizobium sp. 151]MCK1658590.1 hypothetical protein [Bradyrhizobium sp. 151]
MKTNQCKPSKKENRRRAGVKVKKVRRAQGLCGSTTTAEKKHITMKTDSSDQYEDPGLKLSNLFIEDLVDNEDLWLHLGATASIYAESPKGIRKLIDAVLMQMCGITFAMIIAAAEQNTTVLKAEVKFDYRHLPNLDVEELRQCLDEV